jgi:hypothetical protein
MLAFLDNQIALRVFLTAAFYLGGWWYFYRKGGGAGKFTFLLLSIVLGVLFYFSPLAQIISVVVLAGLLIWQVVIVKRSEQAYRPVEAVFEGGGIRRGLTAPEASMLLGEPFNVTLALVIFGMLKKGFLVQVADTPLRVELAPEMRTREKSLNLIKREELRRAGAQQLGGVLYPYEEHFLELLEQEGKKPLTDINFGIVIKPFVQYVSWRLGGYDLDQSRDYYRLIVRRAPKEARMDGKLVSDRLKVFDRNYQWILLNDNYAEIFDRGEEIYLPIWLREKGLESGESFAVWAKKLIEDLKVTISPDDLQIKIGRDIDVVSANLLSEIYRATHSG